MLTIHSFIHSQSSQFIGVIVGSPESYLHAHVQPFHNFSSRLPVVRHKKSTIPAFTHLKIRTTTTTTTN
jgi:hypothetical protein